MSLKELRKDIQRAKEKGNSAGKRKEDAFELAVALAREKKHESRKRKKREEKSSLKKLKKMKKAEKKEKKRAKRAEEKRMKKMVEKVLLYEKAKRGEALVDSTNCMVDFQTKLSTEQSIINAEPSKDEPYDPFHLPQ